MVALGRIADALLAIPAKSCVMEVNSPIALPDLELADYGFDPSWKRASGVRAWWVKACEGGVEV